MEHYVTDWTVLMFLQCGNYNLETSAWLTFDTEHKKKKMKIATCIYGIHLRKVVFSLTKYLIKTKYLGI